MQKGLEKGRYEGRKEAERLKEKEFVLSMLENGFDLDSISKVTKLSKEEIKRIQKK